MSGVVVKAMTAGVGRMAVRAEVRWGVRILLTALFVFFVNRSVSRDQLADVMRGLRPMPMVGALLLAGAGLWCQAKRWEIILRYEKIAVTPRSALKTLLVGNLLAFVTPGRLGELLRGMELAEGRKGDAVFAVIVDKLFIVATVVAAGLVAAVCRGVAEGRDLPLRPAVLIGGVVLVCMLALPLLVRRPERRERSPWVGYALRLLRMTPRAFTRAGGIALICSFGSHALLLGQTVLLMVMLGVQSPWDALTAAAQAYALMAVIPLFVGNIGIREYSFALFLGRLDTAALSETHISAVSLGTSTVVLVMNLILPALGGLAWTIVDNRK